METTAFEDEVLAAAKRSVVRMFTQGLMLPEYSKRAKVPADIVERVYGLINYDEVIAALKPKMTNLVADRIAAALTQELTGDVKRVLAHGPTRERLREAVKLVIDAPR